jgi:hypothetical protein
LHRLHRLHADAWFSESDLEAEQSRELLQDLVQQLLESNHDISRRLQNLENTYDSESILTTCFRNGNNVEVAESGGEGAGVIPDQPISLEPNDSSSGLLSVGFHFSFEIDLDTSRVYRRTQPYKSDVSFTSSAVRTHAWSVFSGLSLSQVSNISAIALPVYSDDIFNNEWYKFVFFDQVGPPGTDTSPGNPKSDSPAGEADHATRSTWKQRLNIKAVSISPPRVSPSKPLESRIRIRRHHLVVLGDRGVGKTNLINHVRCFPLSLLHLLINLPYSCSLIPLTNLASQNSKSK